MKGRDVEKLFGMPHRKRKVEDYYAGTFHGDLSISKKHAQMLLWAFGFCVEPGDMVCAILLREKRKRSHE